MIPIISNNSPNPKNIDPVNFMVAADKPNPARNAKTKGKVQHGEAKTNNDPISPKPMPLPIKFPLFLNISIFTKL